MDSEDPGGARTGGPARGLPRLQPSGALLRREDSGFCKSRVCAEGAGAPAVGDGSGPVQRLRANGR